MRKSGEWITGWRLLTPMALVVAAACVAPTAQPVAPIARAPAPLPPAPPAPPPVIRAPASLETRIAELGRNFSGSVGIAVQDVSSGWTVGYNAARPMPQQSVSKLWVSMAVLDAVDRGTIRLSEPVVVRRENLTVFHQPVRAMMGKEGFSTTYGELMRIALTQSDNTCNDMLLRRAGGPDAIRAMILDKRLGRIAFGPGETLLQSGIAGMEWRPEYSSGNGFQIARAALPYAQRQAAMDRYLADPMDGASAEAIAAALARLQRGELLSPASTSLLLGTMRDSRTGPQRLRGGLAPGWTLAHKTGTGQDLGGMVAGYNDVGVITSPNGRSYAIAVMIGSTRQSIPVRQRLMNDVVRAVVAADAWAPRQPTIAAF
ncbi:beta-lactamase [Sphingomonas sp. DBB INV C78]|uniref:serine hydrolase n=1 Tax=Sphingomonas sp. DBB INV C78 TaxID=3349434 RepID=UPI0036D2F511